VAGLRHDAAFVGAGEGGGCGEASAKAVAADAGGVEAGGGGGALHDEVAALVAEAAADGAMPVDGAEDGAFCDACRVKPRSKRSHGASLGGATVGNGDGATVPLWVGLRAVQRHADAACGPCEVCEVEAGELGAAEGASEADEKKRAVALADEGGGERFEHGAEVFGEDGRCLSLRGADGAADAASALPHCLGGGRVFESGGAVERANGHKATVDGGGCRPSVCEVGEVGADVCGSCVGGCGCGVCEPAEPACCVVRVGAAGGVGVRGGIVLGAGRVCDEGEGCGVACEVHGVSPVVAEPF